MKTGLVLVGLLVASYVTCIIGVVRFGAVTTKSQIRWKLYAIVMATVLVLDFLLKMADLTQRLGSLNPILGKVADWWIGVNLPCVLFAFFAPDPTYTGGSGPGPIHGESWNWFGFIIGQCIQWGLISFVLSLPIAYLLTRSRNRKCNSGE